jgi:hypothetical protein
MFGDLFQDGLSFGSEVSMIVPNIAKEFGIPGGQMAMELNYRMSAISDLAKSKGDLKPHEPREVRTNMPGQEPTLIDDIMAGCLPWRKVCYDGCFAAERDAQNGRDFSKRVKNILDEDLLRADLARTPEGIGYKRMGQVSDASWNWPVAVRAAELIHEAGLRPVFLTKMFKFPTPDLWERMLQAEAELRLSISPLDVDAHLNMRLGAARHYQQMGGTAIPVIMTALFNDDHAVMQRRQEAIVKFVTDHDMPASENALRFKINGEASNSVFSQIISREACAPLAENGRWADHIWAGYQYPEQLPVPTLSTLADAYTGLPNRLSKCDREMLVRLNSDPLPSHAQIRQGFVMPNGPAASAKPKPIREAAHASGPI